MLVFEQERLFQMYRDVSEGQRIAAVRPRGCVWPLMRHSQLARRVA